jgi:hypothetical protein
MRHILLYLIVSFLSVGCHSFPPYPQEWGDIVSAKRSECIDLSGFYTNTGEDASSPDRPIHFGFLMYGDRRAASRIEIGESDDNSVFVSLWDGTQLVDRKRYVRGKDFECTTSEVHLNGKTDVVGENVLGVTYTRYSMMRTQDGSLVVRQSSGGVGLAFGIVPMAGSDIHWYRFRPWESSLSR